MLLVLVEGIEVVAVDITQFDDGEEGEPSSLVTAVRSENKLTLAFPWNRRAVCLRIGRRKGLLLVVGDG